MIPKETFYSFYESFPFYKRKKKYINLHHIVFKALFNSQKPKFFFSFWVSQFNLFDAKNPSIKSLLVSLLLDLIKLDLEFLGEKAVI